jgi:hypothetical protein
MTSDTHNPNDMDMYLLLFLGVLVALAAYYWWTKPSRKATRLQSLNRTGVAGEQDDGLTAQQHY